MPYITTNDNTQIYYKDWGSASGQPVVFCHGWPLNSDNFEVQMVFLADAGYRSVAHDRRGSGRSSQPWEGNHLDQWADDLAELIEQLDLKDIVLVGHSTGGGEITRYCGKHGTSRVKKIVLIGSYAPYMIQSDKNPKGVPKHVFDHFRASMLKNRSKFFMEIPTGPFFGYNRDASKKDDAMILSWWQQGMMAGLKASHDTVASWELDLSEDSKKIDVPTLVIHGDDDQIVPVSSAHAAVSLLPNNKYIEVPGGAHALPNTEPEWVNQQLLEWIKG